MKRMFVMVLLAVASITVASQHARAQMNSMDENPMVGGAAMFKSKDIVDNAVNSADHTTLVAAVKAAGLVETLKSKGPFTVFAARRKQRDADKYPDVSRARRTVRFECDREEDQSG